MKYAIVNEASRIIENVIVLNDPEGFAPPEGSYLKKDDQGLAVIGQELDGEGEFITPEPVDLTKQKAPLLPVTRKQLIDVLIDHDLDEQVEPALNAIPDIKARKKALNAWQNASQYEPDHPLVLQLKGVLKLTNEQFDAFWREAMAA
ncbi:hypothetical protein [Cohaesibacter gelatinilyticus]|uniref:Uncharacterized protein n=1 Tax=Cohaesibacter gelatinilyticus TaxID=372072 RepID=A0A285PHR2_9HYPH|nr:hypothetical protein [Cohaesibacter gelatinilyticus]SNZ20958.1 hypothetical protein SAMN06265368_4072 [Cohaesibacter gelatinilyticus]